ncbi:hypothetical protein DFH29DRAFT_877814 [Suillus ampliporus]|nr:hypothetical protein DFH29DRAFT_877814 [Suillus ampliporus]
MSMAYALPALMQSESPSVCSLGSASHLFQIPLFETPPSRDTGSPLATAHDGVGLGAEFWQHIHHMNNVHAEHASALMIAKSSHRAIHHGRVAAQARVDQFMLLLRALSKELEDWKWKEQEAEQTINRDIGICVDKASLQWIQSKGKGSGCGPDPEETPMGVVYSRSLTKLLRNRVKGSGGGYRAMDGVMVRVMGDYRLKGKSINRHSRVKG